MTHISKLNLLLQDIEESICDDETIIEQYTRIEGVSSLDILIEKERRRTVIEMMKFVMSTLDHIDRKILWLYAIRGMTHTAIAKKMRTSRQSIAKRIDRIHKKLPSMPSEWRIAILPKASVLVAGLPKPTGTPFDITRKVNIQTVKVKIDGNYQYRSKWKCKVDEYFENSFGDSNTICTFCDKCSNVYMKKAAKSNQTAENEI